MPIAIHVSPAHAGAQGAELVWQERLAREIIERLIEMGVVQRGTDILEERSLMGG